STPRALSFSFIYIIYIYIYIEREREREKEREERERSRAIMSMSSSSFLVTVLKSYVFQYLRTWSIAAGCVALFGLMLRVKQLRNISLLVSAIKEGRRFLALISSFMYLLEEKGRLAGITEQVVEIIKSVQIGNRNFQNICVHAKANRSNVLLKLVPNFRVTNEQWMRAIQSKFVDINCQDAFEIGLLKPRDINVRILLLHHCLFVSSD
uniref:ABC transmembrane type-1 domain-containing protein n=1 Tax=Angiostrongylus cantonensis TaxID=6313 RepID=A0A0K0CWN1_ANGCA